MTTMPAKRKAHFKSRKGCLECKKRHTKCNEEHPRCANCIRLNIDCTWPAHAVTQLASPESDVSARDRCDVGSPGSTTSNVGYSQTVFTLEDMQLLHRWSTRVNIFKDVPDSTCDHHAWNNSVMNLAFEHTFLLHGLLAISALHKSLEADDQPSRANLLASANTHMSLALSVYRSLIQAPTPESLAPIFLFSSVVFVYDLASAQCIEPEDSIGAMMACFRLLRGVRVVMCENWTRLTDTFIISQLLAPMRAFDSIQLPTDKECPPIKELQRLSAQLESPHREVCTVAAQELHTIVMKTQMCPKRREHSVVMLWPAAVTSDYIALVDAKHPVAVIILVHFAVLMSRSQSAWCMKGWLERLIKATEALLTPSPLLRTWLEWPIAHIGKTIVDEPELVSSMGNASLCGKAA